VISGFTDKFSGCRVLNSHEDWRLYNIIPEPAFHEMLTKKPKFYDQIVCNF